MAEISRVLSDDGAAFFLTPNAPADFENPFHLHLFDRHELRRLLERHFAEVWLGGVDAVPRVRRTSPPAGPRPTRCWPSTSSTCATRSPTSGT